MRMSGFPGRGSGAGHAVLLPGARLNGKRVLDHVAHPFACANFAGLIIDIAVLTDDHELKVTLGAVSRRDRRTVVHQDKRNVRLDGFSSLSKGSSEHNLLTCELLIDLAQVRDLFAKGALALGVRDKQHHSLAAQTFQRARFVAHSDEGEVGRRPNDGGEARDGREEQGCRRKRGNEEKWDAQNERELRAL